MDGDKHQKQTLPVLINATVIKVMVQVGCMTFIVGAFAIIGGLWLDNQLGTRPWLTVFLVTISMPAVMFLIYKITISGTRHLVDNNTTKSTTHKEENP
jgi:MFS-type transporter involved in bile tolerance (Atg22 family)